ncbi:ciliary-associated calcium-binding coiled-coil protein 1-like isoform X2 [Branchiostoma floridae x Branchiostoma belcheri]
MTTKGQRKLKLLGGLKASKDSRKSHSSLNEDEEAIANEKEGSLAWKVLHISQVRTLLELNVDQVHLKMADLLNLKDHAVNLQEAAVLDYYVAGFWWAKEQSFTLQQISGFITALSILLENIREKQMSLVDNLKELKKMLVGIGQENPEVTGGLDFFNTDQAKLLTNYITESLFHHYKLYQYMFTLEQDEMVIGTELSVEVAPPADIPFPPPLDEGMREAVYLEHVAPPPPPPEKEEEKEAPSGEEEKVFTEEEVEDILEGVTTDELKEVISSVVNEMLGSLSADVGAKLKEREAQYLAKISKMQKIAE